MSDVNLTPVSFNPFAATNKSTSEPVSADNFPSVSPDVQAQRDKVRLSLLQNEQQDNQSDQYLQKEVQSTTDRLNSGNPFGGKGSKISNELKSSKAQLTPVGFNPFEEKSAGPQPLFPLDQENQSQQVVSTTPVDYNPFEAPKPQQGFIGKVVEAAKAGGAQSINDLVSAGNAIVKGNASQPIEEKEYAKPLDWKDLVNPSVAVPKAIYQLAHGAPSMVGGIAGGVAGAAVAPESGPVGALVGGSLGAAAVSAAQSLGPYYSSELGKTPNDPDGAFERASQKAVTDGAFTAVGWAAFSFSPFQGAVKNLLTQALGVQPAVTAAQTATQNVMEGKPAEEGIAESIPGAVVGTLLPAAGHGLLKAAVGKGEAKPAETVHPELATQKVEPAQQEPPLALTHQAGEPLVVFPDGSAMTRAEYENERANGMVHPAEGQLPPIEQARVDAQNLQSGQLIADPVRQRNAQLIAAYGENPAIHHVIQSGELGAVGEAMLRIAPKVEQARQALKSGQENRDITSDIMTSIDELGRLQNEGKSVSDILGPHDISYEGHQLLQFLEANKNNADKISQFMETYLQTVQDMGGVPSNVRGKAFDILYEREQAKKEAEKAQSFAEKEGKEASDVKTQSQIATEQSKAENALTEIAKAKASGSGINPEHQTAMEVAFQNARKSKEKPSEKLNTESTKSVQPTETKSTKSEPATSIESTKTGEQLPVNPENSQVGNAQSVRESGGEARAEEGVVNRARDIKIESIPKEQLSKIEVKSRAIDATTGKRIIVKDKADVTLKDLDHQIETMKGLLECLG